MKESLTRTYRTHPTYHFPWLEIKTGHSALAEALYDLVRRESGPKLIVIDDVVYVGSSNLDQRSLNINYELMVRFENKEMAAQARPLLRTKAA